MSCVGKIEIFSFGKISNAGLLLLCLGFRFVAQGCVGEEPEIGQQQDTHTRPSRRFVECSKRVCAFSLRLTVGFGGRIFLNESAMVVKV